MSLETVKQIIGHAMVDAEFRKHLMDNPAAALKGYDLTEDEAALLKDLPSQNFESMAEELGERLSRAGVVISPSGGPGPIPYPHFGDEAGTLKG